MLKIKRHVVIGSFFAAMIGICLIVGIAQDRSHQNLSANPVLNARYDSLLPEEKVSVLVYENCNRSVVNIDIRGINRNNIFRIPMESQDGGSGIVYDRQGHIITNYHVIEGAQQVNVTLAGGNTYEASAVGMDPVTDLAVLKINAPAEELFPVVFGDSSQLLVGQRIYAIGNPFGLERTLTTGIISSLNRSINSQAQGREIKQVIQMDAAINPGNSGGALLNTSGQLIGINTAIASNSGDNAGIGFAIPVNTAARIVPQLIENGEVIRADIGIVEVQTVDGGVKITLLDPEGPAAKGGILGPYLVVKSYRGQGIYRESRSIERVPSDLIIAVNGKPVKTGEDFIGLVEENAPGTTITVTVVRTGQTLQIPVLLR